MPTITKKMREDYRDILLNYFNPYNMSISNTNIERDLEMWSEKKEFLFELFGSELIVSKTIESNEVSMDMTVFEKDLRQTLESFEGFSDEYSVRRGLHAILTNNNFHSGVIEEIDHIKLNGKGVIEIISLGMRFNKGVKKIIDFLLKDSYEKDYIAEIVKSVQILYSMNRQIILNSKKSFVLSLSIHPLDFLSMSENTSNWSSCQSIAGGESKAGVFSFLSDSSTIVAYITDIEKDPYKHDIFRFNSSPLWNNKKWRQLVHTEKKDSKVGIAYSRQYPFTSEDFLSNVDIFMRELYSKMDISFSELSRLVKKNTPNEMEKRKLRDWKTLPILKYSKPIIAFNHLAIGYNDMKAPKHGLAFSHSLGYSVDDFTFFIPVGASSHCVYCGDEIVGADEGIELVCHRCAEEETQMLCDECGEYHDEESFVLTTDGQAVCFNCFKTKGYSFCSICGDAMHNSDAELNEVFGDLVCGNCNNTRRSITLDIQDESEMGDSEKASFQKRSKSRPVEPFTLRVVIAESHQPDRSLENQNIHQYVFTDQDTILLDLEDKAFVSVDFLVINTSNILRAEEILHNSTLSKEVSTIQIKLFSQNINDIPSDIAQRLLEYTRIPIVVIDMNKNRQPLKNSI